LNHNGALFLPPTLSGTSDFVRDEGEFGCSDADDRLLTTFLPKEGMLAVLSKFLNDHQVLASNAAAKTETALGIVTYEDELEPVRIVDREDPHSRDSEEGRRARMGSRYAFVSTALIIASMQLNVVIVLGLLRPVALCSADHGSGFRGNS
jgi:hypothetical protein